MLTQKFKTTVAVAVAIVVAGGFTVNSVIQEKQITNLENQAKVMPKVITVIATPSATPTATPTASFKFVPKVTTPVK